jgi:hypothetical protein
LLLPGLCVRKVKVAVQKSVRKKLTVFLQQIMDRAPTIVVRLLTDQIVCQSSYARLPHDRLVALVFGFHTNTTTPIAQVRPVQFTMKEVNAKQSLAVQLREDEAIRQCGPFQDAPVAIRALASAASSHRNGKLRLWQDEGDAAGLASRPTREPVEKSIKLPIAPFQCVSGHLAGKPCFFNAGTLCRVFCPSGSKPVYGVACTMLEICLPDNGVKVLCSNMTLFPSGKWSTYMLSILGADDGTDQHLAPEKRGFVCDIQKCLSDGSLDVTRQSDLIEAVYGLFQDDDDTSATVFKNPEPNAPDQTVVERDATCNEPLNSRQVSLATNEAHVW